ncbi:MAG: DUF3284 domain-containing protein [Enterococcus sp.]
MKVEKKLNIPAKKFYDRIMDSVVFDVRKTTGKTLTRKQLNNFEYVKEFSKTSRARITIEEVIENQSYQFKTSTTKNEFVARYQVTPIDEQSCTVVYTENMESYGTVQKMNDMFVGTIVGFFKRRQFKKMLQMIEESY